MRRLFIVFLLFSPCAADNYKSSFDHLRNQEHEKAFRSFLLALDEAPKKEAPAEDLILYQKALSTYLEGAQEPQETADQILRNYSSEGLQLRFITALAYANLGRFEEFFTCFYPSYCAYPDHYLAYKTKAVLHIKLYERCRSLQERESEEKAIRHNIQLALDRNSSDMGLYKLWLLFADEKNREAEVEACLNKILASSMIVSRSDLPFFAEQALDVSRPDLAQALIDKARNWYSYSRYLDTLQEKIKK